MADIQLQYSQSVEALSYSSLSRWGKPIRKTRQYADLVLPLFDENRVTSFTPDVRTFDNDVQLLLCNWEWLRQNLSVASTEELEVDYTYMTRAGVAAQVAPDMVIDDEDIQTYAQLSNFSYTLDDDF